MKKSRRNFIRKTGLALGGAAFATTFKSLGLINAYAQSGCTPATDYKALVCVFLFGGNDANNMVIPYDDYTPYGTIRSSLAIPQASLLQITVPSHQNLKFGFHPNLADMQTLWGQNRLAVMCNVGTLVAPMTRTQYLNGSVSRPDNLFSHEDQQQQCQTSQTTQTLWNEPIGWGGKLADSTSCLNGANTFPMLISVAGTPPFTFGVNTRPLVPSSGLSGFTSPIANDQRYQAMRALMTMDRQATLNNSQSDLMERAIDNNTTLNTALSNGTAVNTVFPNTSLGNQLRQVARIIAARSGIGLKRQIFFCSAGGYDTHSDQLSLQANLFTQLSQALKAFYDSTVELGVANQVTTFTMSDFNRTLLPAQTGTDHAWGGHQFIIGDAVLGGNFYGLYPRMALSQGDDAGNEGRWIPTTAVDQYGATLANWFGLDPALRNAVFPNLVRFPTTNLGFLS
jgi:uncharacterized protein (DUF1501 family)